MRAQSINDHGKGARGLAAVAAAIVQQHDVAAGRLNALRAQLGRLGNDILRNLLGSAVRRGAPVVGINFRSNGDVAHGLNQSQRLDLRGSIRLFVNRIGRAEEHGLYA